MTCKSHSSPPKKLIVHKLFSKIQIRVKTRKNFPSSVLLTLIDITHKSHLFLDCIVGTLKILHKFIFKDMFMFSKYLE